MENHSNHKTQMAFNHEHSANMFAERFWICLLLSIPAVWFSGIIQNTFNLKFEIKEWMGYAQLVIGALVFFYGGAIFLKGSVNELKKHAPGMMTLVALAITTAFLYSATRTILGTGESLWWELASLITIMLLGHWLELKAVEGVKASLEEIVKLLPDKAEVIRKSGHIIVSLNELKEGDLVLIRPGGVIPADGIILEGSSQIDESVITGESRPVVKSERDQVIAGSINGNGALTIRVEKMGEKTFIAGIKKLISTAQSSKSTMQLLSDRSAMYLTIVAIVTSIITLVSWMLSTNNISYALERMVAVLVVACPHALGLAVPLVASRSTSIAARNGILVRERLALERARLVDTVVFDKTGTLTKGVYAVQAVIINPIAKTSETQVLQYAASINSKSEHAIAKATFEELKRRDIKLKRITRFERLPGKGVRGYIDGSLIIVGGERIIKDAHLSLSKKMEQDISRSSKKGETIIYVIEGETILGAIALGDLIRKESKEAVAQLGAKKIDSIMLTGDTHEVASWVARMVGIKNINAKVFPQEKSDKVLSLQKKGHIVAMVGDGINDAPALAQADVGIAIGSGTNVAIESAGILLIKNDPRDVITIINLSRVTYRKMIQNLWWAAGYNIIAIPIAAGALIPFGIVLQPATSAALMSASTLIVAVNAFLLRLPIAKLSDNGVH